MGSTENLISAVYKRPAIWDPKHYLHKNRSAIQILWEEIAAEVGIDSGTLKHKWKVLREFHRNELKRMRSFRKSLDPNEPPTHLPIWQFFPLMSFLNDTMLSSSHPRGHLLPPLDTAGVSTSRENLSREIGDPGSIQETVGEGIDVDMLKRKDEDAGTKSMDGGEDDEEGEPRIGRVTINENLNQILPNNYWEKMDRRKLFKNEYLEKLLEIEKKKIQVYEKEKEDEDDDLMFFKSFLPDLKTLSRVRKLYLKLKFQELLYREISSGEAETEPTASVEKRRMYDEEEDS